MVSNGNGFCKCNLTPFSDLEIIESGKVIDGLKMGSWEGNRSDNKMNFKEVYNAGKLVSGTQFRDNEIYEYDRVEKMASPTCGLITFYKYVSGVMRYPRKARRAGVQGRVFVEFVINRTGELQDVKIVKGISSECDEEALKAVKSAPKWNPGLQRGVPVKQRMVLPLTFKLG
jgi:TonB family protein